MTEQEIIQKKCEPIFKKFLDGKLSRRKAKKQILDILENASPEEELAVDNILNEVIKYKK